MQDLVFSLVEKRILEKDNQNLLKIAVNFSAETRNIEKWIVEKIENTALNFLKESVEKQCSLCSNTKLVVCATILCHG